LLARLEWRISSMTASHLGTVVTAIKRKRPSPKGPARFEMDQGGGLAGDHPALGFGGGMST
jgi:hypothetical protein